MTLLRVNAVGGARPINWKALVARTHRLARNARRVGDTYPAIAEAVRVVRVSGDPHATFFTASDWKEFMRSYGSYPLALPTVRQLSSGIPMISLRELAAAPSSQGAHRYETSALAAIEAAQRSRPCGWIVDLRYDGGGDMLPMLLSVGPILGEGNLIGFAGRRGFDYFVSYRGGTVSGDHDSYRAPVHVPVISPTPPVAVIIGPGTISAGEAVAVAFRGRPETRFFGSATAGATNSPQVFRLSDGAVLFFGIAYELDRNRTAYRGPIVPDVSTTDRWPRSAEKAATRWLLATSACRRLG